MIRPIQPGDLFLIQRLNRQATKFPTVQTLLHSHSALRVALGSAISWGDAKATTYVLRQKGHGLVHEGFLQVQKRQGSSASDVLCLAPGLEAPSGHPAIWNKLLSHYLHAVLQNGIERIYASVSDQPLPVTTFANNGFQVYGRQTIWRLFAPTVDGNGAQLDASFRPATAADAWSLARLYQRTVPAQVQQAEGWVDEKTESAPPLVSWAAAHGLSYLMVVAGEIVGGVRATPGRHGSWLEWWTDVLTPGSENLRQLLRYGLSIIHKNGWRAPIYTAVAEFQGGVDPLLTDLGFAPFSDRVLMVKQVAKWIRETITCSVDVIESASEVVPTSFAPPGAGYVRQTVDQPFLLPR